MAAGKSVCFVPLLPPKEAQTDPTNPLGVQLAHIPPPASVVALAELLAHKPTHPVECIGARTFLAYHPLHVSWITAEEVSCVGVIKQVGSLSGVLIEMGCLRASHSLLWLTSSTALNFTVQGVESNQHALHYRHSAAPLHLPHAPDNFRPWNSAVRRVSHCCQPLEDWSVLT